MWMPMQWNHCSTQKMTKIHWNKTRACDNETHAIDISCLLQYFLHILTRVACQSEDIKKSHVHLSWSLTIFEADNLFFQRKWIRKSQKKTRVSPGATFSRSTIGKCQNRSADSRKFNPCPFLFFGIHFMNLQIWLRA